MSSRVSPPLPESDSSSRKPIVIKKVWDHNVEEEFRNICSLIDDYPFVSMDTEFPGVVYNPTGPSEVAATFYDIIKSNVDNLKLIQVGLTYSDADGNLPDLGTENRYIWEFNLDFNLATHAHSPASIKLLKAHGMDFDRNQRDGIESGRFGELLMSSGLVCNKMVTWVVFQGSYDFAYLIKILTGEKLPENFNHFRELLKVFFGNEIYDVKYMMKVVHLHGGLDRVANGLDLKREVGDSHQAGSDSLLTWRVFQNIKNRCSDGHERCAGVVHGFVEFLS